METQPKVYCRCGNEIVDYIHELDGQAVAPTPEAAVNLCLQCRQKTTTDMISEMKKLFGGQLFPE